MDSPFFVRAQRTIGACKKASNPRLRGAGPNPSKTGESEDLFYRNVRRARDYGGNSIRFLQGLF